MARKRPAIADPNTEAFQAAWRQLCTHPMFAAMRQAVRVNQRVAVAVATLVEDGRLAAAGAVARVASNGDIRCDKGTRLTAGEWTWVLAHCLLHLGFGHLGGGSADSAFRADPAFRAAACVAATRFQRQVKIGVEPDFVPAELPASDEDALARQWRAHGVPPLLNGCRVRLGEPSHEAPDWPAAFARGLSAAATAAIDAAGGAPSRPGAAAAKSVWERARGWFMSSYPLLGGVAAGFTIVADADLARAWQIGVAAVSSDAAEIYVNPLIQMSEAEWRFVLAHEMLHAALRHGDRAGARDPYLWNVACDYVINGWLVEMGVGEMTDDVLHDPQLAGLSADEVYDRVAVDLRRLRKLMTLRGRGAPDILGEPLIWTGTPGHGVDLDDFYRRALLAGYAYHQSGGRGALPAGLVEEIRVLDQPPLPWDARLARWFDEFVTSPERSRSYARPSRRQASAPDIPRAGWRRREDEVVRHTFGVVLDTSGSMDHTLLGKALGAIASYATARDVPAARVVFCDAVAYDAGYLPVIDIAGRVRVRGRGGTVLQPAVTLLERAPDFPPDAPVLIITDGECDVLRPRREHAYLLPQGARLPFTPRGPVFTVR